MNLYNFPNATELEAESIVEPLGKANFWLFSFKEPRDLKLKINSIKQKNLIYKLIIIIYKASHSPVSGNERMCKC